MREENKYIFKLLSNSVHNYVNKYANEENLNMYIRSMLAECYLAIDSLLKNEFIVPHEIVILKRDLAKIYNAVYKEESLFYCSSFSYAYSVVKGGDIKEIQNQFKKINLDIMAMLINIKSIMKGNSDLGSSIDSSFFSTIENCTWAFTYVINKEIEEYYIPSLYCIGNMIQTLILYYKAGKSKFRDQILPLIDSLNKILNKFLNNDKVKKIIHNNNQLSYFIENQLKYCFNIKGKTYDVVINLEEVRFERIRSVLRILTSLFKINKQYFKEYFKIQYSRLVDELENMNILDKILFLRSLSDYNYHFEENDNYKFELGMIEIYDKIDIEDFLNHVFNIEKINVNSVKQSDIDKLKLLKDCELRARFSHTIKGVSKRILDREASKPHGVFEISDMEVPIIYHGKKIYLCMPFKSGVEILQNSVPINVAYQIIKPYAEFSNCVVVFVTAKRCSESLMNYIKKIKDKMGWPIGIIEDKVLAGLLLMNGEI
ncbi:MULTISPECIES: hypothetical protein [Clostridium]|uniref:hypothetical protein n=1 Tax=Clostridium TaxID=1485 RepID=UPI000825A319|nr:MULTISPECIES: hypothetical protein [Clostridium]PJI09232.1 hypothetical protein CUB90_15710 [Clostridium sp. CT7]